MPTQLPTDANQNPIQVLRLKAGAAHSIAATSAASARNTTAFGNDTLVVTVFATQPVYLRFGDATVSAAVTDHYFPANTYCDIALGDKSISRATYMAARAVSTSGTVYISEKE